MDIVETVIKDIKELSGVISWPIAFLVCTLVFRLPITNLINRITKAQHGGTSIEAPIAQAQIITVSTAVTELGKIADPITEIKANCTALEAPAQEKNGTELYLQSFDNPLIKEVEDRIIADLQSRNIVAATDKERVLTRALASTQLVLLAEQIYAGIWGSQVAALRFLNGCASVTEVSTLHLFYNNAKNNYPDWYRVQDFDKWLHYLAMFNLIKVEGSQVVITVAGRQFLKYMADAGKPERVYG